MPRTSNKRAFQNDMLLAAGLIVAGFAISGVSMARIATVHPQVAQATQPLQSTPGAESKPSAPSDPNTTGSRPQEVAPQPARPDADAVDSGAKPALPPAPAEKTAAPIPTK